MRTTVGRAVLCAVLVLTVGYVAIDGYAILDARYMTVITVFTVGYEEVHPLSPAGRIFNMLLIFCLEEVPIGAGSPVEGRRFATAG